MNTLKSVFWEYPEFAVEQHLHEVLAKCRASADWELYLWVMRRFLENGRVVDTFKFFSIDEILANLDKLRLSEYSSRKWHRLGEVYRASY
jgi:hypothetical protein